ncbi:MULTISPECIES: MarR family winged helix-turn-helix transcriptional regulator [Streptomyces]|uniref:MarR family transcriptional regulator n=1 Tax=Streptomyces morookaense TaxID=1970 RepID=A0A7Y7B142_STRMO|nr:MULTISPECIES: MarR family transcriptional regulator [Streptomyces]MCC2277705.1 MarR family transcriptional regulator [Streptomyces sp. ET3-23]NVK77108.1 MarR family transcriptional regulator [Streptomyces morookaense]GHF24047.1 MarR family transcriptional regulator [Streptomyces morookaense]
MNTDEATVFRRNLMALHRRLREEHVGDIPLNEVLVLGAVDRHGASAGPGVIADDLRMARSNLAALLRRLEARELVDVAPDPADGRRSLIGLTRRGRELLERDRVEREMWLVKAAAAALTPAEAKQLLAAGALMQRLADFREHPEHS